MPSNLHRDIAEFADPPVNEVVCGVTFRSIEGLLVPHFGVLWESLRNEFPGCKEMPPLAVVIERFGERSVPEVQISDVPPLPRVWFVREDQTALIQVQRERFLYNWKRMSEDQQYPGFEAVFAAFQRHLAVFEGFLRQAGLGMIEPIQYEITYVDIIPQGKGWNRLDDLGAVFPDFSRRREGRFLPEFETVNFRTTMVLPDYSARVHVGIRNAFRQIDAAPVLRVEWIARGMGAEASLQAMEGWFSRAHEFVTRGFTELTSSEIQGRFWGSSHATQSRPD